jgi:uncharacterized protein YchJ
MELKFKEEHFKDISLRVNFNEASNFQYVAVIDVAETRYAMYEQYCKNIHCDCTGAAIEMVRVIDNNLDKSNVLIFDFDYEKKKVLEAYSPLPEHFEAELVKDARFVELLKNRSLFVKNSFEQERLTRETAKLIRQINKTTPRNAPCPCESGRKYKNCCGK